MVCLIVRILRGREWGSAPGGPGTGRCMSCAGRAKVYGAVLALDDEACAGRVWRAEGTHVRVLAGSRPARLVVLVTTGVVRDTPLDCHFSAWSRPKPAPDPLPGPSVASGVIPTKGGRNGVFQPPPEGPRRAGGDPAPGNVATTRLPGAGSGSTPHR